MFLNHLFPSPPRILKKKGILKISGWELFAVCLNTGIADRLPPPVILNKTMVTKQVPKKGTCKTVKLSLETLALCEYH
jgi:hypothetical protein